MSVETMPERITNLAEQHAELIPVIQIAPPNSGGATLNKLVAQEIADSIRVQGLYSSILLRPLPKPDGPALYELVYGLHRLYACTNILGWDKIPAVVVALDDEDTKMARLIENCARKRLKRRELFEHVAEWRKIHAAKVGAKNIDDLRIGRQRGVAKSPAATSDESDEEGTTESEPAPVVPEPNLQKSIAHATGTSDRTAHRTIRVATMIDQLSEEEKEIIFPEEGDREPDKKQLEALADLTMMSVSEVLKLVASGMPWEQAIATGNKRPGRKPSPVSPPSIDDLSDDDWVQTTCADRLAQLKRKTVFKGDAILYRKFAKLRKRVLADVEALLLASKSTGPRGPFHVLLERAFRVNHPDEWAICGFCQGAGKLTENGSVAPCSHCYGHGYRLSHTNL
jgi:ParB-like chromosome segregation protein Spo0J